MALKVMTPEQIDKHLFAHAEKLGIKNISKPLSAEALTAINIGGIYATVRPVLVVAQSLLTFIKPTWATVVGTFIAAMDKNYPNSAPIA